MYNNDYKYKVSFEELYDAYRKCCLSKPDSLTSLSFEVNLEDNLLRLRDDINSGQYEISRAVAFIVEKPVKREVFAADFSDRIVHHLVMDRLIPYLERDFIYDSYACRPGRGTLFGIKRLRRFIAKCSSNYTNDCYILKCDIEGFFMNIDRDVLWTKLQSYLLNLDFRDRIMINRSVDLFGMYDNEISVSPIREFVLGLLRKIALNDPTINCKIKSRSSLWNDLPFSKSLFGVNGKVMPNGRYCGVDKSSATLRKGIPIGNLTSQWFGNFYLNDFDHYMKSELKLRYYGRYVDDFVVVHKDRRHLEGLVDKVRVYLKDSLGLTLHPKKVSINHWKYGVSFLGVVLKRGVIITGRRTRSNFKSLVYNTNRDTQTAILDSQRLGRFAMSTNSYLGLIKHHSSYKLRRGILSQMSCQLCNRLIIGKGCLKVNLRDYTIAGDEMLPYYEY